ncbi:hypothetical protein [Amycolatopsis rubida]|uniref:hypothetical protein n=1 Tax=Amycolatopsis rubida TaxID=112413 RepID=UPI001FCC1989|nr:hypothetical protein [Amycolatopsis rubida]
MLREATALTVHAPAAALHALTDHFPARSIIGEYHDWTWHPSTETTLDGLVITSLPIHDPRQHARPRALPAHLAAAFDEFAGGASLVLLDGTFYHGSEFTTATGRRWATRRSPRRCRHSPTTQAPPAGPTHT